MKAELKWLIQTIAAVLTLAGLLQVGYQRGWLS